MNRALQMLLGQVLLAAAGTCVLQTPEPPKVPAEPTAFIFMVLVVFTSLAGLCACTHSILSKK